MSSTTSSVSSSSSRDDDLLESRSNSNANNRGSNKFKVCYFHDDEVGGFYYGEGHPMKPHRMNMTHSLVMGYRLHNKMAVYRLRVARDDELLAFHSPEYLNFLKRVTPITAHQFGHQLRRFNVGDDCPVFDGVYRFCQLYSAGSIDAALKLCHKEYDIAINWSGGLHHARREEASGFCYVNDIVLGILELLKYHARVLYIDIDVHHGDAVQDAFYMTDRVMTVSFHKFGDQFFPGTGDLSEIGLRKGKHYSVNVPLLNGIDDRKYVSLFKEVIDRAMEVYRPTCIVFQSGADSLQCDRLGCFNLSLRGHADCLAHCKSYQLPILLLGGGGYTVRNVARCWTFETAVALDRDISNDLPYTPYLQYFAPGYQLHPRVPIKIDDQNTEAYIDTVREQVFESMRYLNAAPSVQMHHVPSDTITSHSFDWDFDETDPDIRMSARQQDLQIVGDAELFESPADQHLEDDGSNNHQTFQSVIQDEQQVEEEK